MESIDYRFPKTAAFWLATLVLALAPIAVFGQAPTKQPAPKTQAISQAGQTDRRASDANAPSTQGTTQSTQATTQANQDTASDELIESGDVVITATIRASSLRFDVVPNPKVEFFGKPDRITVWEAERINLPTPVQPGVTYRDIGIKLKIVSRFRDIERIVAEALGEIPVTDDVSTQPPKPSTPPQPASSSPPPRERR